MSPTSHTYFDYYQSENKNNEPLAIGGYLPMEKVYEFDPIPKKINNNKKHLILGGQANLWTEYITTTDQIEYMLLPRICALSEAIWSLPNKKNYTHFTKRLDHHLKRLKRQKLNFRSLKK